MKKRYKYLIVFLILCIGLEIGLRLIMDIGEKPLYEANTVYEYAPKPNQDLTRFHHHYQTNAYGMRSKPINKKDKKRILLFGDSVLNGGTDIDQSDILPYVLADLLTSHYHDSIGVYAASAGSWGVENAYGFLTEKIDFDFDAICLVFSGHDYHDNMHHRPVVGKEPAWPDQQPFLAITDLIGNGILPKVKSLLGMNNYDYLKGFDDSKPNPGFELFKAYAEAKEMPLWVYVHPEQAELKAGAYEANGAALLADLGRNNIVHLNGLDYEDIGGYVDKIHVNHTGHKKMAEAIFSYITTQNILGFEAD